MHVGENQFREISGIDKVVISPTKFSAFTIIVVDILSKTNALRYMYSICLDRLPRTMYIAVSNAHILVFLYKPRLSKNIVCHSVDAC